MSELETRLVRYSRFELCGFLRKVQNVTNRLKPPRCIIHVSWLLVCLAGEQQQPACTSGKEGEGWKTELVTCLAPLFAASHSP